MRIQAHRAAALAITTLVLGSLFAPAAAADTGWQAGPGAASGSTSIGFVDAPTPGAIILSTGSFLVRGWFVDTTAQGWAGVDDAQVWLGPMDGGGQRLAFAQIGQARPDVASATGNAYWVNSGFSASVPGSAVPGGPQTLYIYVHTPGNGWWFQTVAVNGGGTGGTSQAAAGAAPQISILTPVEGENIFQSTRQYTITGTVSDARNTTVEVWLDGDRNAPGATQLGIATIDGNGSWLLVFSPSQFPTNHHTVRAYAVDHATALQSEAIVGFNIVNR